MSSQSLNLFFRACEVSGPLTLRVEGGPEPTAVMRHPFAVVGRDPRCDVAIDDATVNPRQCYLQAIGPKVLCIDLGGGRGGVAGQGPALASWIDGRHAVRVGNRLVRLAGRTGNLEGPDGGEGDDQPLLTKPVPRIALEFQTDTVKTRWRMRRVVALVGTARECTVRLNGASVARYHCAVVHTGLGLWVVDLLGQIDSSPTGAGGIFINREPVRFGRLDPGDVLQVGGFGVSVLMLPRPSRSASRSRTAADMAGSGEIEVAGHGKEQPIATAANDSALEVDAVRREYEHRLSEQAEAHRAEVEDLRTEIEELRGQVEALRSAPASRPRRRRDISVRVLGTATRRVEPIPAPTLAANDPPGVAIARPDLPPIDPAHGDPWANLGALLATPQGTRHSP